ncbi:MAG: hypothetical protein ACRDOZ_06150 [Nocardioides sp.]
MAAVIALLAAFGLAFADQGPIESAAAAPPVVRTRRRGPATQHRARRHASRIAELSERRDHFDSCSAFVREAVVPEECRTITQ